MTNLEDDENNSIQNDPQETDILEIEEDEEDSKDSSDKETLLSYPKGTKVVNESDDENELVLPDDAEADLLTILEEKIHAESLSDEEEEYIRSSDDTDSLVTLLQPKRLDEQHCQSCWLLVRKNAPKCPEHRDDCPIFIGVG